MFSTEIAEPDVHARPRRRSVPRQILRSLAYVRIDQGNGGIIRDLTERGIAVQAVAPLRAGQEVRLQFELLAPRVRVDTIGHVTWGDSTGQSGIEFHELPPRVRKVMRDWLLVQMLSSAVISGRDSMFALQSPRELTFSPAPQSPIVVEHNEPAKDVDENRIAWAWFSVTVRTFAMFVDSLVLLCAVLIFSISSILVMGGTPAWPLTVALLFTSSTIFVAIYRILFSDLLCGATPGTRLAHLAGEPKLEDEEQRFR